LLTLFSSLLLP
jgi:hypothetical protein